MIRYNLAFSNRRGIIQDNKSIPFLAVLQTMLSDTPLVKNLDKPEYREFLLDGKASLEERFAALAALVAAKTTDSHADIYRMFPGFLALASQ